MRWTISSGRRVAVAAIAALSAVSFSLTLTALPSHAQAEPVLAIDADATGNTPTELGQRDVCIEVKSGDTFDVDVTTQDVVDLYAFEGYVELDVNVVNVIERDASSMLLASAAGGGEAFDLSESVPETADDNGLFRIGAGITSGVSSVSGSGVLSRLTLEAVGPGLSTLSVRPVQVDVGTVAATLTDVEGNSIGDTDGDSYFDGAILDAQVAVDQECPADAGGPIAALTSGDSGGIPSWVFAAGAVGIVAAAAFGGMALIRMRRTGTRGAP
jgi:hypothetical protein